MKKYEEVYNFKVEEAVKNGATVVVVDKKCGTLTNICELEFGEVVKILNDNSGRFYYYIEEVAETEETGKTKKKVEVALEFLEG